MKATTQTLKRAATRLIYSVVLGAALTAPAHALKSDRNQPAVINADDVELDFQTGSRTYTGNVSVQQGSMQLICDRLVATFENNKLSKATAFGSAKKLAIFKQRPDGKPYDVVGRAEKMVLDQIAQTVVLSTSASLQQGSDSIAGDTIIYNMETDKMSVKGRSETQIKRQPESKAPAPQPAPAAPTPAPAKTAADLDKTRQALPAAPSRPKPASEIAIVTPAPPPKPAPAQPIVVAPQPTEEEAAANRVAASTGTRVTTTPTGRVRIVLPPRSKRKAQN